MIKGYLIIIIVKIIFGNGHFGNDYRVAALNDLCHRIKKLEINRTILIYDLIYGEKTICYVNREMLRFDLKLIDFIICGLR